MLTMPAGSFAERIATTPQGSPNIRRKYEKLLRAKVSFLRSPIVTHESNRQANQIGSLLRRSRTVAARKIAVKTSPIHKPGLLRN
jgi:hypothetical protein